MGGYYLLKGKEVVKVEDVAVWAVVIESMDRQVDRTNIEGVDVSTVFLGLDHRWGCGPPLLFETMVFGGSHDGHQWRYSTWKEAQANHKRIVKLIKGELNE